MSTNPPLTILSIGAGAIGTYIGGSLAINGNRVVFLEQPRAAETLRTSGMTLKLTSSPHHIAHPEIADSLEKAMEMGPYDAALFAVKSYHTAAAIEMLKPAAGKVPPILCLQNGVDNEPVLEQAFGENRVIAGTITSAIGKPGPGTIALEKLRGMGVAGSSPLAHRLTEALNAAGLNARHYPNGPAMKWSKLLTNLIANPTSAILNMSPAEIFSHPGLHQLEMMQLREALAVMDRLGLPVVDLPGTPVRLLAWAARTLPPTISRPIMAQALGKGRGQKMPSFHIDLYAGAPESEIGYLHGAVVRYGAALSIPTPVNKFLTETLLAITHKTLPQETFARNPEAFLKAANSAAA